MTGSIGRVKIKSEGWLLSGTIHEIVTSQICPTTTWPPSLSGLVHSHPKVIISKSELITSSPPTALPSRVPSGNGHHPSSSLIQESEDHATQIPPSPSPPFLLTFNWASILQGGTSLVAQWLTIHLPMQGTQFEPWSWSKIPHASEELSACAATTEPMCHNYWACALEPASHTAEPAMPQLLKPVHLEPVLHNKRNHLNEKPMYCNEE